MASTPAIPTIPSIRLSVASKSVVGKTASLISALPASSSSPSSNTSTNGKTNSPELRRKLPDRSAAANRSNITVTTNNATILSNALLDSPSHNGKADLSTPSSTSRKGGTTTCPSTSGLGESDDSSHAFEMYSQCTDCSDSIDGGASAVLPGDDSLLVEQSSIIIPTSASQKNDASGMICQESFISTEDNLLGVVGDDRPSWSSTSRFSIPEMKSASRKNNSSVAGIPPSTPENTSSTSAEDSAALRQPILQAASLIEEVYAFYFLRMNVRPDPEGKVVKQELHQLYTEFVQYHKINPLINTEFGKVVKSTFPFVTTKKMAGPTPIYTYQGISLDSQAVFHGPTTLPMPAARKMSSSAVTVSTNFDDSDLGLGSSSTKMRVASGSSSASSGCFVGNNHHSHNPGPLESSTPDALSSSPDFEDSNISPPPIHYTKEYDTHMNRLLKIDKPEMDKATSTIICEWANKMIKNTNFTSLEDLSNYLVTNLSVNVHQPATYLTIIHSRRKEQTEDDTASIASSCATSSSKKQTGHHSGSGVATNGLSAGFQVPNAANSNAKGIIFSPTLLISRNREKALALQSRLLEKQHKNHVAATKRSGSLSRGTTQLGSPLNWRSSSVASLGKNYNTCASSTSSGVSSMSPGSSSLNADHHKAAFAVPHAHNSQDSNGNIKSSSNNQQHHFDGTFANGGVSSASPSSSSLPMISPQNLQRPSLSSGFYTRGHPNSSSTSSPRQPLSSTPAALTPFTSSPTSASSGFRPNHTQIVTQTGTTLRLVTANISGSPLTATVVRKASSSSTESPNFTVPSTTPSSRRRNISSQHHHQHNNNGHQHYHHHQQQHHSASSSFGREQIVLKTPGGKKVHLQPSSQPHHLYHSSESGDSCVEIRNANDNRSPTFVINTNDAGWKDVLISALQQHNSQGGGQKQQQPHHLDHSAQVSSNQPCGKKVKDLLREQRLRHLSASNAARSSGGQTINLQVVSDHHGQQQRHSMPQSAMSLTLDDLSTEELSSCSLSPKAMSHSGSVAYQNHHRDSSDFYNAGFYAGQGSNSRKFRNSYIGSPQQVLVPTTSTTNGDIVQVGPEWQFDDENTRFEDISSSVVVQVPSSCRYDNTQSGLNKDGSGVSGNSANLCFSPFVDVSATDQEEHHHHRQSNGDQQSQQTGDHMLMNRSDDASVSPPPRESVRAATKRKLDLLYQQNLNDGGATSISNSFDGPLTRTRKVAYEQHLQQNKGKDASGNNEEGSGNNPRSPSGTMLLSSIDDPMLSSSAGRPNFDE